MSDKPVSLTRTLDQRRASHAYAAVEGLLAKGKEQAKKAGGQARKLPSRVMASGLGQALAFLKAKKYAPELLVALGDWVLHAKADRKPARPVGDEDLLQDILNGTSDTLRRHTDEVLAYMLWFNRFAEGKGLFDDDAKPQAAEEKK